MWTKIHQLLRRGGNLWGLWRLLDGVEQVSLFNRLIRGDLASCNRSDEGRPTDAPVQELTLRRGGRKVALRPFTADVGVFREVIAQREYQAAFDGLPSDALVVDLGSNIGMSILAFQLALAKPRVVGIEPDVENLAICRRNVVASGNGAATVVHGAVGPVPGLARLHRDGLEIYGFKTEEIATASADPSGTTVRVYTVPEMLDAAGILADATIDLLKCDIEGAEASLFRSPQTADWLRRVDRIAIELHDPYVLQDFTGDLQKLGWRGDLIERKRGTGCDVCILVRTSPSGINRHAMTLS